MSAELGFFSVLLGLDQSTAVTRTRIKQNHKEIRGFINKSVSLLLTRSVLAAMSNGRAYLNIQHIDSPYEQIDGFIYQDVSVPAPGMLALIGMCGVLTGRRRR